MFGANARMSIIANQAPPAEIDREEELMCELRTKLGPGPDHERLLYHIRSARGKVHWAVNSYLREVMSAPGAMTQPQTGTYWASCNNKTSSTNTNTSSTTTSTEPSRQHLHQMSQQQPSAELRQACAQGSVQDDSAGNAVQSHGVARHTASIQGCSLEGLPVGVLEHVVNFLSCPKDVIRTATTCRTLFKVATYDKVWQGLFTSRWGEVFFPTRPGASLMAGSARRRAMSLSLNLNAPVTQVAAASTSQQPAGNDIINRHEHIHTHTGLQLSISSPVTSVPSSSALQEYDSLPRGQLQAITSTSGSTKAGLNSDQIPCPKFHLPSATSRACAAEISSAAQQQQHSPAKSRFGTLTGQESHIEHSTALSTIEVGNASEVPSSSVIPGCGSASAAIDDVSHAHSEPCSVAACSTVLHSHSAPILNTGNTHHNHHHQQQQKQKQKQSILCVGVGNGGSSSSPPPTSLQSCSLVWLRHYVRQLSWETSRACPSCGSQEGKIVPILYGFPSPALLLGMRSGRLILGGDHLIEDCHCWACTACNASFRTYPYEQPHLWVADHEKQAERAALMKQRRNQQAQHHPLHHHNLPEPGGVNGVAQQNGHADMAGGLGGGGLHGNAGPDFDDDNLPTYTYEL